MRCGDCKHWNRVEEEVPDSDNFETKPSDFGICKRVQGEAVQHYETYGGQTTLRAYELGKIGDRDAVPCDGSGYHAALLTRDHFGCIRFAVAEPSGSSEEPK